MRITFSVTEGPHAGKTFCFRGHDTFLVGRSRRAHFRLPDRDRYFSRVHFLVEVNPPHCRLLDMGSTNGTFVNGHKVISADLADGDVIHGGQTSLLVTVEDDDSVGSQELMTSTAADAVEISEPPSAPSPLAATLEPSLADSTLPCLVCGVLIVDGRQKRHGARTLPVCSSCQAHIREQTQVIPGYRIVRELGRGGMGVVSLALHDSGAVVALKTIRPVGDPSPRQLERFLREANILRELRHPHIVAFRDLGVANGQLWFAMDFVRGTDAARLLEQQGPFDVARAVTLTCQLLEALQYAHAKGFVHRDVKPANLLVTTEQGIERAKLVDFGLARVYQASRLSGLSVTGQLGGTVPYMAPEQLTHFRECRPPVDQYAAAATLYTLLTRGFIHDFPVEVHRCLAIILQEDAVPIHGRRADLPAGLAEVIHRALARDPERRFADVAALRQALRPFCSGDMVCSSPVR